MSENPQHRMKLIVQESGDRGVAAKAFAKLEALIPDTILWAARTSGQGPWSFITPAYADITTFKLANGERIAAKSNTVHGFSSHAIIRQYPWMPRIADSIVEIMFPIIDRHFDAGRTKCLILVRRHAAIALFRHADLPEPAINLYLPSPIASGHDLFEDPAALEREFPGRFAVEGLEPK